MKARCEACKRNAPKPTSQAAQDWTLIKLEVDYAFVCPKCAKSPDARDQLVLNERREQLADALPSMDAIVFPNGKAKRFGDCTAEDAMALARQEQEGAAESAAIADWLYAFVGSER